MFQDTRQMLKYLKGLQFIQKPGLMKKRFPLAKKKINFWEIFSFFDMDIVIVPVLNIF